MKRRTFMKTALAAMAATVIPSPLMGLATPVPVQSLAPMVKVPVETIEATQRWMRQMDADLGKMLLFSPGKMPQFAIKQ